MSATHRKPVPLPRSNAITAGKSALLWLYSTTNVVEFCHNEIELDMFLRVRGGEGKAVGWQEGKSDI